MMGSCMIKNEACSKDLSEDLNQDETQFQTNDETVIKLVDRMKENIPTAPSSKVLCSKSNSACTKSLSTKALQTYREPLLDTKQNSAPRESYNSVIKTQVIGPSKLPLSVKRKPFLLTEKLSKDDGDTRRMLDKNRARLMFADDFKYNIEQHLRFSCKKERSRDLISNSDVENGCGVKVYVRKRPLFQYEMDNSEFDVVGPVTTNTVTVNDCRMLADMKQMQIRPIIYPCTFAFDHKCEDDAVFAKVVRPLIHDTIINGGNAAVLMFGQTGTGKSHTMSSIEKSSAKEIFQVLVSQHKHKVDIKVQFIEIVGKSCRDLLCCGERNVRVVDGDINSGNAIFIMHAKSIKVETSAELIDAIKIGKKQRSVAMTDKNGTSSRSHALCRILFSFQPNKSTRSQNIKCSYGAIDMLDLAGTERRNDSLYHDAERQKESNEINSSLWALKECIRAKATQSSRIPYRSHVLTRLLRGYFEKTDTSFNSLSIIATIAPTASDTEHTMETLKTVSNFMGSEHLVSEQTKRNVVPIKKKILTLHPKQWNNAHLVVWLKKKNLDKACNMKSLTEIDGKLLLKMSIPLLKMKVCGDLSTAETLFKELRKECDRASKKQLKTRLENKS